MNDNRKMITKSMIIGKTTFGGCGIYVVGFIFLILILFSAFHNAGFNEADQIRAAIIAIIAVGIFIFFVIAGIVSRVKFADNVGTNQFRIVYDVIEEVVEPVNHTNYDHSDHYPGHVKLRYTKGAIGNKVDEDEVSDLFACRRGERAFVVVTDPKNSTANHVYPERSFYLSQDLYPFVVVPEKAGWRPIAEVLNKQNPNVQQNTQQTINYQNNQMSDATVPQNQSTTYQQKRPLSENYFVSQAKDLLLNNKISFIIATVIFSIWVGYAIYSMSKYKFSYDKTIETALIFLLYFGIPIITEAILLIWLLYKRSKNKKLIANISAGQVPILVDTITDAYSINANEGYITGQQTGKRKVNSAEIINNMRVGERFYIWKEPGTKPPYSQNEVFLESIYELSPAIKAYNNIV